MYQSVNLYYNLRSMFIRKHLFSWWHLEINSFNHSLSALIMCIFSVRQRLHRLEIVKVCHMDAWRYGVFNSIQSGQTANYSSCEKYNCVVTGHQ